MSFCCLGWSGKHFTQIDEMDLIGLFQHLQYLWTVLILTEAIRVFWHQKAVSINTSQWKHQNLINIWQPWVRASRSKEAVISDSTHQDHYTVLIKIKIQLHFRFRSNMMAVRSNHRKNSTAGVLFILPIIHPYCVPHQMQRRKTSRGSTWGSCGTLKRRREESRMGENWQCENENIWGIKNLIRWEWQRSESFGL